MAVQGRRNLRVALRDTPKDAPDFPETLAIVRDAIRETNVATMSELAEWVGLDRPRLYKLLRQADAAREERGANGGSE
jgi:DNA-binding phage protein